MKLALLPDVESRASLSFKEALEYARAIDTVLVPYEKAEGIESTRDILSEAKDKSSVAVFTGPEGGFDEKEIELAGEMGAKAITLGKRILRTETAGLCVLSVLMFNAE